MKNSAPKRLPFLLWGDLRKSKKALLRYALAGEEAHLPIYFYVYLRELFEYKKLFLSPLSAKNLNGLRANLKKISPEKIWLLSDDQILRAYFISIIADNEKTLNVWELGSTIFTIYTKVEYLIKALKKKFKIIYYGIEKNTYLSDLSKILHPKCKVYSDVNKINLNKTDRKNLFVSRFVSSYVFKNTASLADLLVKFDYGYLTEPFNLARGECLQYNHGLPNIFFDFVKLLKKLLETHDCFCAGYYYDYPAGTSPCFVCDLVFISKKIKHNKKIKETLQQEFEVFEKIEDPIIFAEMVRARISKIEKSCLALSKRLNPVWGKVDLSNPLMNLLTLFLRSRVPFYKNYNFKFNNYYLIQKSLADHLA